MSRFVIVRPGATYQPVPGDLAVTAEQVPSWALRGGPLRALIGCREAVIVTSDLCHTGRPFALASIARLATRGPVCLIDAAGAQRPIAMRDLMRWAAQIAVEPVTRGAYVRSVAARVDREFAALAAPAKKPARAIDPDGPWAYLRTDLSYGVRAGGSVGHIAGVLNNLHRLGRRPLFVTTDLVPTVDPAIEACHVCSPERFWSHRELPAFAMDEWFEREAERFLRARGVSAVYQRNSLNNFSGVRLSRSHSVPLILEYNGSEAWVSRHWGARALRYEGLSVRIEDLNFAAADLIVVVSSALRDELRARGVHDDKILVNPNGVDIEVYSPRVDGSAVRARLASDASIVFGFIGTFGAWHGASVLAEAYGRLLERRSDLRERSSLIMIGDGREMPRVRAIVEAGAARGRVVFTGLVPQAAGPSHLAACDVLVSPHVPNADGSPFFGSPTKLFEYMAMGRAIVASDLDQIGEVLAHGETAWLVPPGDADALAAGLARVADDASLRLGLSERARAAAETRHSWLHHTQRIVDALAAVEPARAERRTAV